jgi:hypothetical protein
MTFTKCNERGIMRSVGWCEAKPTQLKSPGRFSSFPFPHLSPLKSAPALPVSARSALLGLRLSARRLFKAPFSTLRALSKALAFSISAYYRSTLTLPALHETAPGRNRKLRTAQPQKLKAALIKAKPTIRRRAESEDLHEVRSVLKAKAKPERAKKPPVPRPG